MKRPVFPSTEQPSHRGNGVYEQYLLGKPVALIDGAFSVVPQIEAEVPNSLSIQMREIALRGVSRRQQVTVNEIVADNTLLVDEIIARDGHITDLQEAHENDLALKEAEAARLKQQRDAYKEQSELSDFGGLLNKTTFKQKAKEKINAVASHGEHRSTQTNGYIFVFGDVDRLNYLNSILTESVVDSEILERVALILAKLQRDGDLTSNWGGDEFATLLQGSEPDHAEGYIKRAVSEIGDLKINPAFAGASSDLKVGLSFGYAIVCEGVTYAQAEQRASRAKEYAKETGKSMVNFDDIPADWVSTRKDLSS